MTGWKPVLRMGGLLNHAPIPAITYLRDFKLIPRRFLESRGDDRAIAGGWKNVRSEKNFHVGENPCISWSSPFQGRADQSTVVLRQSGTDRPQRRTGGGYHQTVRAGLRDDPPHALPNLVGRTGHHLPHLHVVGQGDLAGGDLFDGIGLIDAHFHESPKCVPQPPAAQLRSRAKLGNEDFMGFAVFPPFGGSD